MKILKISNGEIRHGYEIEELEGNPLQKVVEDLQEFLYIVAEDDDERANAGDPSYIKDFAEANGYLFDEDGNQLPLTYQYSGNQLVKVTFGKNHHDVEIIDNPAK
jgi:hypothetical protein